MRHHFNHFGGFNAFNGETLYTWQRRVQGRPGWVWKATLLTAVLVVAVPILLLVATAVIAAAVVFTILSLIARGAGFVRRLFTGERSPLPADDGRRNVRVRVRGPEDPWP